MKRFLLASTSELEIEVFQEFSRCEKLDFHTLLYLDSRTDSLKLDVGVNLIDSRNFDEMSQNGFQISNFSAVDFEIEQDSLWALEIFLEMMKRQDRHKDSTYEQRRSAFSTQISFWAEYLKRENINDVFFSTCPHEISDFTLYIAAQTLRLNLTILQDNHIFGRKIATSQIFSPWISKVDTRLIENSRLSISDIREALNKGILLDTPKWLNQTSKKQTLDFSIIRGKALTLLAGVYVSVRIPLLLLSYLWAMLGRRKNLDNIFGGLTHNLSNIKKYFSMLENALDLKFLTNSQSKYVREKLPDSKFFTLFLNFNPEMMVNPLGFPFNRDMNIIAKVRSLLRPEDVLLVREHPNQYSEGYGYLGRNSRFYSDISSFSNTFVISSHFSLGELLDSSEMIFTLNGTVGWQAAVRGVKVGIMGSSWYENIPNSFRIHSNTTSEELWEWFKKFSSSTSVDLENYLVSHCNDSFKYLPNAELADVIGYHWDRSRNKLVFSNLLELIR